MVTAETAIAAGREAGSIRSRSMTTDVSSRPGSRRASATGSRVLIDERVEVAAETPAVDSGRGGERRHHLRGRDEFSPRNRSKLTDRHAGGRPEAGFGAIQRP